ncbi:radical SAM protein [Rhodobacteraceae bacterium HSP-20]|uniref:Radical SAM protein n=1 Tax=Paragemmobacter amnigenus TaxID=2852097 RepID=A0ABS6J3V4_9RHOB|nr:radical SAM/SPASM domain-containing protein [Rhodobacter amnigenus]MBU9698197.1 radical SAM protein [Rhodobacter amnigenus]MBV4389424.1 radical SAM protein [Rhodobacter amnigenus]
MYIGREMYSPLTDPARQRELFAQTVGRVEVETHSYCNRRCDYCPNVVGDRLGPNVRIKPAIWEKLLRDLAEVGYSRFLVLNSYNEPLYDRAILDRIAEARAALPRARIMIYTNGDYLTPSYVDDLAAAGLDYMHVSIHLKQGDKYSDVYVLNRIAEIAHRTGLQARFSQIRPNDSIIARFDTPKLEMETRAINFDRHGNDRGGLLPDLSPENPRTDPCNFVFQHFHMGYTGNVVPCCHIRSDRPEHAKHVIGNLDRAETIFDIFFGAKAAAWRRGLIHDRAKTGPCATCTAPVILNQPNWRELLQNAYQRHVAPLEGQAAT